MCVRTRLKQQYRLRECRAVQGQSDNRTFCGLRLDFCAIKNAVNIQDLR